MHRGTRPLVSVLFLLSGATALVYQIAWTRDLSLIFGASYQAVAVVLAAFMGGLALGGYLLGWIADRVRRPLRCYGWLEFGVAAAGLLLPFLLAATERVYVAAAIKAEGVPPWLTVMRFAMAFILLVIPTSLMGGTLPMLTRFVVRGLGDFGPKLAWLYAINTAGAVVGALTAGFVLLPALGVGMATRMAVAGNVIIGIVAVVADRRLGGVDRNAAQPAAAATAREGDPATDRPRALQLAFMGTFVSGFSALALEVMWTRGIGLATGTTTYSFTIMLAAFLVGIAFGSTITGLFPLRQVDEALQFGIVMMTIGITSMAVTQLIPHLPQLAVELNSALYGARGGVRGLSTLAISFAVMLVPTIFMGIAFPLAGRARARLATHYGRTVGEIIGLNTLGAILGPLVAGFVLIPWMGLQRGMLLVSMLYVGYAIMVLAAYVGERRGRSSLGLLVGMVAAVLLVLWLPSALPTWDRQVLAAFRNNVITYRTADGRIDVDAMLKEIDVLYYVEGSSSTVSVIEAGGDRAVLINGKSVATDGVSDLQHEYLLGHLPVLLHPDPKSAAVIGLGAGITLGGVTAHEGLERIDLVEIEPAVIGAARIFGDVNGDALDDSRLRIFIQDGRNFLRTTAARYDVITADPIHPWAYGAAYLYTTEYYRMIADRLTDDGVMCQWLPIYELSEDNLRSVVRSFSENFPHNTMWQTGYDAVLIGSKQSITVNLADWQRRLAQPEVARQLGRIGVADPMSLLAEFTLDQDGVAAFAQGGPLNTDDNLYLEFSSPHAIATADVADNIRLIDSLRSSFDTLVDDWSPLYDTQEEARQNVYNYMKAKSETVQAIGALHQAMRSDDVTPLARVAARLGALAKTLPEYGRPRTLGAEAFTRLAIARVTEGDQQSAVNDLRAAIQLDATNTLALVTYGQVLLNAGRPAQAVELLARVVTDRPNFPDARLTYASALASAGRAAEAIPLLEQELLNHARRPQAVHALGVAFTRVGRYEDAVAELEALIKTQPDFNRAYHPLAVAQIATGDHLAAVRTLEEGLRRMPNDIRLADRLALLLATSRDDAVRDPNRALDLSQRVLIATGGRIPLALFTRAVALAAAGRFDEAIQTASEAADVFESGGDDAGAQRARGLMPRFENGQPIRQ